MSSSVERGDQASKASKWHAKKWLVLVRGTRRHGKRGYDEACKKWLVIVYGMRRQGKRGCEEVRKKRLVLVRERGEKASEASKRHAE